MNLNRLFRQLNIQRKLIIAFVLLSTVPVCVIGFYEINSRLKTLENIAIQNVQHDVLNVQEKAQAFIEHVDGDIHYLSRVSAFQKLVAALKENDSHGAREQRRLAQEIVLTFVQNEKIYYRLKFIDTYGDEIFSVETRAGNAVGIPEKDLKVDRDAYYLVEMRDYRAGQIFLAPAELHDPAADRFVPVISYALPVFDAQGIRQGILIADIFAESFFKILEGSHASPPGRVFVVSQEGYYLYHPEKKHEWSKLLASRNVENLYQDYSSEIASQILSGTAHTITQDSKVIISYAPLFYGHSSYRAFYVVYRDVPKDVLFASVKRFRKIYISLIVAVVFFALFFGFLAARQFTNPILQLIEGAGTIGQGNFDHRLQIETSDEIEDLAVQFNQMAAAIREREAENVRLSLQIQQHADGLEEMVDKRTKELREAQAQLVQAEMLGAIGRLAAGVAHEINNPMAVISTCVEGLHARLKSSESPDRLADLPEYLTAIREAAYRCKGITQKLLSFSRQSPLAPIPTDVNQRLRETVALVDYEATQAAKQTRLNLDPDLPIITADPDQLGQVFLNLTLNALDAMSAGDWLEICTHFTPGSANIEIRFQDTGCGISPDQIGKVFEPFYTTKGAGRGTGLGLAICQGIIQSHQGSITIESVVGEGSTFVIQLPLGETDGRAKEDDNPTADRGR